MSLLLQHGAKVNAQDTLHGQTALMFAAALNRAPAIRVLMEHGADAKITTKVVTQERVRLDQDGNPVTDDANANADKQGDKQGDKQADKQGDKQTAKAAPTVDFMAKCPPAADTAKKTEDASKNGEAAAAGPVGQGRGRGGRQGGARGGDAAKGPDATAAKDGDTKAGDAKASDAKAALVDDNPALKAVADLRTATQALLARMDDLEKQIRASDAAQAGGRGNGQREKGASALGGMTALLLPPAQGHVRGDARSA